MLSVLVMSCLLFASRTTRAQDSFQIIGSQDLSLEADTAPPFLCLCGTRIHTNENRRKCPAASVSGITRRPKIPIIFYCSGTIRAGRFRRKVLRGGASVFGPGSGGTPSRRTIRRGGRHRLSERHVQSRIPDAAGRHCAGSGP